MRIAAIVLPLLLSSFLFLQAYMPTGPQYFQGTFQELRKEAFQEDRPYILFFSYAKEDASRELEEYTFREPNLSEYISRNYFIYKINVDSPHRGDDYLEADFGVENPGLMIFDAKSYILERIPGYVEPETLLATLRKHQPERGNYATPTIIIEDASASIEAPALEDLGPNTAVRRIENEFFGPNEGETQQESPEELEVFIIDQSSESPTTEIANKELTSPWKRKNTMDYNNQPNREVDIVNQRFDFEEDGPSKEYIEMTTPQESRVNRYDKLELHEQDWKEINDNSAHKKTYNIPKQALAKVQGFGIQTGVFEESYFMRQEVGYLQSRFRENIFVNKSTLNGKVVYKVQVGPFESEAAARSFEAKFRQVSNNRKGMLIYIQ